MLVVSANIETEAQRQKRLSPGHTALLSSDTWPRLHEESHLADKSVMKAQQPGPAEHRPEAGRGLQDCGLRAAQFPGLVILLHHPCSVPGKPQRGLPDLSRSDQAYKGSPYGAREVG
jgi:hypothetical protein